MGTKKLSDISKVTTIGTNDYVVINLADGTQGQIKKSDFAKAIAEILPAIPATNLIRLKDVEDLNTVHEELANGVWFLRTISSTVNGAITSGMVVHCQRDTQVFQIQSSGNALYMRVGVASTQNWRNWERII